MLRESGGKQAKSRIAPRGNFLIIDLRRNTCEWTQRHYVRKSEDRDRQELGVYDTVKAGGWGDVSSKDCGNMVRKAIELAERNMNS
jgi:hypothetical protein